MGNCEKLETRNKIEEAFWKLFSTTRIERITVKSITDACGIYRTTFYLHFSDIYAILEEIEEKLLEGLDAVVREPIQTETDQQRCRDALWGLLERDSMYLSKLLNEQDHPEFARKYKKELEQAICRINQVDVHLLDTRAKLILEKTLSGMIDMGLSWTASGLFSFAEIGNILDDCLKEGILFAIKAGNQRRYGQN